MTILARCVLLTAKSFYDRTLWAWFLLSGLVNTCIWGALLYGIWYLIHDHSSIQIDWIRNTIESASIALAVFIAFLLFPFTFPLAITLFEEYISIHVERKYYGSISAHSVMNIRQKILMGARFFGILLLFNLLLIPFYFIPVVNIVLYYTVNGYLLSREFFEMVAGRYTEPDRVREIRKQYRWDLMLGGMTLVACAAVPVLNLAVPILAVVFMVHFYHIQLGIAEPATVK